MSLDYYGLQKEIYNKLVGNSSLISIISGVFDSPPQGVDFPFVVIGNGSASELANLSGSVIEYQFDIHVWSREGGHKQSADIMGLIYDEFHNGTIVIANQELLLMEFLSSSIRLENDGWTYRGEMRLKVMLTNN